MIFNQTNHNAGDVNNAGPLPEDVKQILRLARALASELLSRMILDVTGGCGTLPADTACRTVSAAAELDRLLRPLSKELYS